VPKVKSGANENGNNFKIRAVGCSQRSKMAHENPEKYKKTTITDRF
jgi:hypothetical protein